MVPSDAEVAELLGGRLYTTRRSHPLQAAVYVRLSCWLYTQVDVREARAGNWTYLNRGALHLAGDVLVPELAVWRAARLTLARSATCASVVPDLVCEVRSPSPEFSDHLDVKLPRYQAIGVPYVWLVDAVHGTLDVLERSASGYRAFQTCARAQQVVRAMPLDNVPLDLSRVFPAAAQ